MVGTAKMATRTARSVLAIATVLLAIPAGASAQLEVGGGFAQVTNTPPELFEPQNQCPPSRNWVGEGRLAYLFSRAARLEVTGGYHWASSDFCSVSPPPPPETGPGSITTRNNEGGFPFFSTDARLAFEPSSPSGPMWLRAFGGYGVMWSKDVGYWLAGGGLVLGQQVQTVFEVEWNWFSMPFTETTLNFQDGVLVSTDTTTGSTSHSTFRLRAAFRWSP